MERFAMTTGTATVCVFDLEALKHRVGDYADWWSDEDEELKEVNAATVVFVALGADGRYEVAFRTDGRFKESHRVVSGFLKCPSGRVFVGPGEDVSGGDLEPDRRQTSGRLFGIPAGDYIFEVCRLGSWEIGVSLSPTDAAEGNAFEAGLSVAD
jgi:hypothetical protein